MSKGTDGEIFTEDENIRTSTNGSQGGASRINRDLARRLFQGGFSTGQVAKKLKCHIVTARRIRNELEASGDLAKNDREPGMSVVQADFDEECKMAIGISFKGWLTTQTPSAASRIFNFSQRVWDQVWDRPSLVMTKDSENQLGDQLCMKFLEKFAEDKPRIRDRKKLIRYIFRFLGRRDLCDRYLTMTQSRDPRPIRRVPLIETPDFPTEFQKVFDEINRLDNEVGVASEFKLCAQMRTGNRAKDRGLMGIKIGMESPSYIWMTSPDEFKIHVVEKKGEEWDITWLPRRVRERMWTLYCQRSKGEPLFSFPVSRLRNMMGDVTEKLLDFRMTPHDLRKISVTWLYVMGVPLELAVEINVGWKDLNTPKDHYLHMRNLLKRTDRLAYADKIGDWYKDGLDEYAKEED